MSRSPRSPLSRLALLLAAWALVLAACSDSDPDVQSTGDAAPLDADDATGDEGDQSDSDGADSDPDDDADDDNASTVSFPLTVTSGGNETTLDDVPEAIVSMSPTATEMLFAIGAGDLVVAADSFSNFPAEAPTTELSAFTPNVEAIIDFEPDLVVLSQDRDDVVAGLAEVGVPSLILPSATTITDSYEQIELLGQVTANPDGALAVVQDMRAEIDAIVADLPDVDEPLTYYHELDPSLFAATSETFIGDVYGLLGLENVADAADPDGSAGGFPQLSAEFLLDADPDLVFLACTTFCDTSAESFGERDGYDVLTAVENGTIVELDEDISSRWGPRIVDFLRVVADATQRVAA